MPEKRARQHDVAMAPCSVAEQWRSAMVYHSGAMAAAVVSCTDVVDDDGQPYNHFRHITYTAANRTQPLYTIYHVNGWETYWTNGFRFTMIS